MLRYGPRVLEYRIDMKRFFRNKYLIACESIFPPICEQISTGIGLVRSIHVEAPMI
jgi:hypothetical protein